MFSCFIAGNNHSLTGLVPLGREAENKSQIFTILSLVSLNTEEENQAGLFPIHSFQISVISTACAQDGLSSCYFRRPLDDSFSHWYTNHPARLKSSSFHLRKYKFWHATHCFGWETKEKHQPVAVITEISGNCSFYSVSKNTAVSEAPALTEPAVDAPSDTHEVFIIPDLFCSATACWR